MDLLYNINNIRNTRKTRECSFSRNILSSNVLFYNIYSMLGLGVICALNLDDYVPMSFSSFTVLMMTIACSNDL
jgi:hypothetical protein